MASLARPEGATAFCSVADTLQEDCELILSPYGELPPNFCLQVMSKIEGKLVLSMRANKKKVWCLPIQKITALWTSLGFSIGRCIQAASKSRC